MAPPLESVLPVSVSTGMSSVSNNTLRDSVTTSQCDTLNNDSSTSFSALLDLSLPPVDNSKCYDVIVMLFFPTSSSSFYL